MCSLWNWIEFIKAVEILYYISSFEQRTGQQNCHLYLQKKVSINKEFEEET